MIDELLNKQKELEEEILQKMNDKSIPLYERVYLLMEDKIKVGKVFIDMYDAKCALPLSKDRIEEQKDGYQRYSIIDPMYFVGEELLYYLDEIRKRLGKELASKEEYEKEFSGEYDWSFERFEESLNIAYEWMEKGIKGFKVDW